HAESRGLGELSLVGRAVVVSGRPRAEERGDGSAVRIETFDFVIVTIGNIEDAVGPGHAEGMLQADHGPLAVNVAEVDQALTDERAHPARRVFRPGQQVDGPDAADLAVRQVENGPLRIEGQTARLSEHCFGKRAIADVLATVAGPR